MVLGKVLQNFPSGINKVPSYFLHSASSGKWHLTVPSLLCYLASLCTLLFKLISETTDADERLTPSEPPLDKHRFRKDQVGVGGDLIALPIATADVARLKTAL